jgi:NAD(P)-dependent dehydrogenase (short-subunit alcohol dehydrogenase family)
MKLDNTIVALVTGGTSGLGEATVYALLEKGVRVFIADRNEEKGLQIVAKYGSDKCGFKKTDVSDEAQVKELINAVVAAFGAIHLVLNSAGIISAGLIVGGKVTSIS